MRRGSQARAVACPATLLSALFRSCVRAPTSGLPDRTRARPRGDSRVSTGERARRARRTVCPCVSASIGRAHRREDLQREARGARLQLSRAAFCPDSYLTVVLLPGRKTGVKLSISIPDELWNNVASE